MDWKRIFEKWGRVVEELWGHTFVIATFFICMWLVETLVNWLWGKGLLFFDQLPLRYVVQAIDLCALIAFGAVGIIRAIRAYKGEV